MQPKLLSQDCNTRILYQDNASSIQHNASINGEGDPDAEEDEDGEVAQINSTINADLVTGDQRQEVDRQIRTQHEGVDSGD